MENNFTDPFFCTYCWACQHIHGVEQGSRRLQSAGAALMIEEKDLTEGEITAKIESVVFDPIRLESMRTAAKRLGHPDASEQIYNWIQQG